MVCRGADVGSSYYLVRALMRLRLKKLKKTEKVQSFVIAKLKDPKSVEAYHLQLRNRFQVLQEVDMEGDVEDHWAGFKQTVPNTAEVTIGRRRGSQREKWIQEQTWELIDEGKKTAGKDRTGERGDSSTVQQSMVGWGKVVGQTRSSGWRRKGTEADAAVGKNDTRALYWIIGDLTGTRSNSNVPIKDKQGKVLLTAEAQDSWWVEHFKEILNQPELTSTFDFANETKAPPLAV